MKIELINKTIWVKVCIVNYNLPNIQSYKHEKEKNKLTKLLYFTMVWSNGMVRG
jgi:hypothetical protein